MYTPKHFRIEELVSPEFFAAFGHRGPAMFMAFDPRALATLDRLRERFGPLVVNNWRAVGEDNPQAYKLSGLRPFGSGTGAALSQHIFGRAFDCKFRDVTAAEVRKDMRAAGCMAAGPRPAGSAFEFIARIEEFPGMGWLHFDTGNHDPAAGVLVVVPQGVQ